MLQYFFQKIRTVFSGRVEESPVKQDLPETKIINMNGDGSSDIAALKVLDYLVAALAKEEKEQDISGVYFETLLTILGAAAGFSVQMSAREALVKTGRASLYDLFLEIEMENGKKFYIGDFINEPLLSAQPVNVWSMIGGASIASGADTVPDYGKIFTYKTETMGSDEFGSLNIPEIFRSKQAPEILLNQHFANIRDILHDYTDSIDNTMQWPFILGYTGYKLIMDIFSHEASKNMSVSPHLTPAMAAEIFMQSAILMSALDPDNIKGAYL